MSCTEFGTNQGTKSMPKFGWIFSNFLPNSNPNPISNLNKIYQKRPSDSAALGGVCACARGNLPGVRASHPNLAPHDSPFSNYHPIESLSKGPRGREALMWSTRALPIGVAVLRPALPWEGRGGGHAAVVVPRPGPQGGRRQRAALHGV